VLLEAQLEVDPRISVSEGHQLGEVCTRVIMDKYQNISDVVVHIDPESHAQVDSVELPLRHEIVTLITRHWEALLDQSDIKNIDLHYLGNGIEVDLYLISDAVDSRLASQLAEALRPISAVKRLKIYNNILETSVVRQFS
jgi:hypothetical protein